MANKIIQTGPPIQPNCAVLHASDSIPEPITEVIICETHVLVVPVDQLRKQLR